MLLAILTMTRDARFSVSMPAYFYGSAVPMIMVLGQEVLRYDPLFHRGDLLFHERSPRKT